MTSTQKWALTAAGLLALIWLYRRSLGVQPSTGDTLNNTYNPASAQRYGDFTINNMLEMPPLPANPNSFTYLFETTNPGMPDLYFFLVGGNPWAMGNDLQYMPLFGLIPRAA